MTNVYRIARGWQYTMIGSSAGLVLIFLLPVFFGNTSSEFIWSALITGGISGALAYGVVMSKIITSPEGIESISFGMRVQATWDKVEKVEINPYGFVNLIIKKPLYKNRLVNGLFRPFGYDRIIQLSPYIEDLATSDLLGDIEKHVPVRSLPESLAKHKRSRKPYQKVGTIGFYYLGWLLVLIILSVAFRKWAEDLEALGFSNMTSVSQIVTISLMIGLVTSATGLFGYNSEIAELSENEISHTARAYYLSPIVALLLGFVVGVGVWFIIQAGLIIVSDNNYGMFSLIGILTATVSLRVSRKIERLLFQDKIQ